LQLLLERVYFRPAGVRIELPTEELANLVSELRTIKLSTAYSTTCKIAWGTSALNYLPSLRCTRTVLLSSRSRVRCWGWWVGSGARIIPRSGSRLLGYPKRSSWAPRDDRCDFAHISSLQQAIMPAAANGDLAPSVLELTDDRPKSWRGIMKALITALALVTLISAPSFAQRGDFGQHYNNSSPASPDYGSNGY
jgi:hypothetical protein